MKPKKPRFCAFLDCPNDSVSNPEKSFYTFPLDADRCKVWIQNCRRTDLADKHVAQLYRCFYLCSDHFESSAIVSCHVSRPRLTSNGVPTLFNYNSSETSSKREKRKTATRSGRKKKRRVSTDVEDQDLSRFVCVEDLCKVEINEMAAELSTAANCRDSETEVTPKHGRSPGNTRSIGSLAKQVAALSQEITRFQAVEQEYEKLKCEQNAQSLLYSQTLAKLRGKLQYETQVRQKWKTSLEKLGLPTNDLDNRELFFERLLSNADLTKALTQRLVAANTSDSNEKSSTGELKACLKILQAQVSTLESERSVLRGTCAQLSAEKEEAVKSLDYFKENYDRLLRDQINLEKLQEQLVSKNDELLERWRVTQRAFNTLQTETRTLREEIAALKEQVDAQQDSESENKS